MAWKKYGRLPWKDLFRPAIEIATNGFPATPAILAAVEKNAPNVSSDPGLRWVLSSYMTRFVKEPLSFNCGKRKENFKEVQVNSMGQ